MQENKDKFGIKGRVNYKMFDAFGNMIWEHNTPENTITELHDVMVADHMAGGDDTLITHAHCGTGSGQTSSDTNLDAPMDEARTAIDSKTQDDGGDDNDVIVVTTFGAGVCTGNIEEAGLFSSSSQETADMKCYDDSISKSKGANDTLEVTWTITYGAS
jgi:hypothetical protein